VKNLVPLSLFFFGTACGGIVIDSEEYQRRGLEGEGKPAPEFFLPDEFPLGASHEEWLSAYWQWHMSIPFAVHPREGGDCAEGQAGDVWFLTTGHNGSPERRSCSIPSGKAVFLLFNSGLGFPRPDCFACTPERDAPELWVGDASNQLADTWDRLRVNVPFLEIDQVSYDVDPAYYWMAKTPFLIDVPVNDPYFPCSGPITRDVCGWSQGDERPFAAVGHALMLKPLPPGNHVLRLGAKSPTGEWLTDVTYELTVQ
jgi:hypothetical protein